VTSFVGDSLTILSLKVLEAVLLGNAASPLRKALLESGLGDALADGTGLHDSFREAVFAAGLKGVSPDDVGKVEDLVVSTLRGLAENGVDPSQVDAAIHRLEIESREVSNAGFPYALRTFFDMAATTLHGGDPYASLQFGRGVERLQELRACGRYFEDLIRKHFLENPHRATILLAPDHELSDREGAAERERLDAIRAGLSGEQVQAIVAGAGRLKLIQETPDDPEVLPTLELSDVPTTFEDVPYERATLRGATVGLVPQPTNGLSYLDVQAETSGLPAHLKDLLPVFAFALPRMGGGSSDYLKMAARIDESTGGIDASSGSRVFPAAIDTWAETITLSGKALQRNHDAFLAILRDLLADARWDRDHLKNLLGQLRARLEASFVQAGHQMAISLAASQFGGRDALRYRQDGLGQVALVKRLATLDAAGLDALIDDLETIRTSVFRSGNLRVCVTSEAGQLDALRARLEGDLLAALPGGKAEAAAEKEPVTRDLRPQARTTAVPVAYDAKVFKTVPYTHPDAAALSVLASLLRDRFLHPEIREKGGAYGGFAVTDAESGLFAVASYRDPHIVRTFKVFEDAADYATGELNPTHVKEAILAAARNVDPLLSPDNKGRVRFFADLYGYTLDVRSQFKARLLATTPEDLARVSNYLRGEAALAVITSEEKIREANEEMGRNFETQAI
ncbi:MAG TPA: insulinase family protein, partial [Deinococcales bacterium]|nr:insulinase family protein [Deinococcales bacterium]